ncbi:helix-turn-helix transcriptional regulator [Apilactobacillus quenuiae]|uniref:helix-turn-helix transcriptional regulator n=1 Tax=Apilactobacillus quenuiae TaxID=2008377 RepID=UPI00130008FE|nr:helix-turn-helix transcriptional regulator [Apilactobacillus quenuiae]
MEISIKLKKARKDKKLTQEYVASQINVSRKTISSWENGRGKPNSSYLKQLNSIYDTNLQLHYTQNKNNKNNKNNKTKKRYFNIMYFINLILFSLCLINIFTDLLTGIVFFLLLFDSFLFINYREKIYFKLSNKRKYIFIFGLLSITLFGIIMNNLQFKYNFSSIVEDIPFFIGAIIHSLILTFSFLIIANYRNLK